MQVPKPKNYCRCGCGTEIKATRKWVSGHNFKSNPSPGERRINGRTYTTVNCDYCNKEYEIRKDHIGRRNGKHYCSYFCSNKLNGEKRKGKPIPQLRTGKYKKCKECGSEFYVQKSFLDRGQGKFCSKGCNIEWIKRQPNPNFAWGRDNSGKRNGMYKNGKHTGRGYRGNKRKIKENLICRDGGKKCLLCGELGDGLHMHRVIYGSQGGEYKTENCVQLCRDDHALVHGSKETWLQPLLDYLKDPSRKSRDELIKLRADILGIDYDDEWWMEQ